MSGERCCKPVALSTIKNRLEADSQGRPQISSGDAEAAKMSKAAASTSARAQVQSPNRPLGRDGEKLPAALRQVEIARAFEAEGYVGVTRLADELCVSTMTIRRDIAVLEEKGILRRTHGGAVSLDLLPDSETEHPFEPPFAERVGSQTDLKGRIARAAARLVGQNEVIALDVGTSTLLLAQALSSRADLRVITNNLSAASVLAPSGSQVYLLGGQIRWPELSIVGAETVNAAQQRFTDRVFLGISGLDESGCFDYSPEDTLVKQAYVKNTASVVVLCDSSKFNRRAMTRILDLDGLDCLVTDAPPPPALAQALEASGVRIVLAEA
jgi:DeoR/GlpR family transcriptional regulator of sugar metabolism